VRIFIVGPNQCGKSAAAQFLAETLGVQFAETGRIVIRELAKLYGSKADEDRWAQMISVCKREYREELTGLGDLMTRLKPDCLIDACADLAPIVVGVRRRREVMGYLHGPHRARWNSIWIKVRGGRSAEQDDHFELHDQPANYEVRNFGSLDDLRWTMREIGRLIVTPAI
jgi:hypothetical protein